MRRLHPATMIVAFLPRLWDAARALIPFLAVSFATGRGDRSELFLAAMGVLGGFGAISTYLTTRFAIEGGELAWRSGWIYKKDRRIPLDHIHNVNLRQGVLERLLNVVSLEIETAAGSEAELKLQVLSGPEAEQLKRELLASTEPRVEPEDEPPARALYRMSREDLLLGAVTENEGARLVFWLLTLFGGAAIVRSVSGISSASQMLGPILWLVLVGALFLVVMLGWVYGAVTYALKFGNFAVFAEPASYRISHGLLSRAQYVLRTERVEYVLLTATVWQRLVGRATLRVGTAGSFGEMGRVVPLAMMVSRAQAEKVAEDLIQVSPIPQMPWRTYPLYYLWVRSGLLILTLGIAAAVYRYSGLLPGAGGWLIQLAAGFSMLSSVFRYLDFLFSRRRAGHALGGEALAARSGFFTESVVLMPLRKIEVAGTNAPLWWKRRGVTSLDATGMVHSFAVPMMTLEESERILDALRDRAQTIVEAEPNSAEAALEPNAP